MFTYRGWKIERVEKAYHVGHGGIPDYIDGYLAHYPDSDGSKWFDFYWQACHYIDKYAG